jgi:chromosomal replication initiator protein
MATMNSLTDIWSVVMDSLSQELTQTAINTWFSDCTPIEINNNTLIVHTTSDFKRSIIQARFEKTICAKLYDLFSCPFELVVLAGDDELLEYREKRPSAEEMPEMDGYTFDRFIVGPSNKFAHAAAIAVSQNPGKVYNPLIIYGNSGLGKTHLLNAIGHELKKNFPDKDIIYVKGDQFANELIEAIRAGTTVSFREKYRKADALLIDDIQFIAGKESTQEEFFHTFNTLYESKKQIVLTSDRPPRDIATLEDRLKTRFEWGLTADVQPPDFETRMAIIKRKAELVGLSVPDNVCEFIAQKLKSNIRQLEGTVKKLNAIHLVEGATPTISTAQRAISDIVNNEQPAPVTVSKIIEEVGRTYGVSPEDIKSSKRNANVSFARQISMYVVREITQMPMVEIGKEFGGRDHSTVVYAIQQIEEKSARDPVTKATVSDIIKNIRDR